MDEQTQKFLTTIAENVPKVKQQGYDEGQIQGQYDVWDMMTNGRKYYHSAFAYWSVEYLRPPFKIIPTLGYSNSMFGNMKNLKKVEKAYFDLSQLSLSQTDRNSGNSSTWNGCGTLEEIEDIGLPAGCYYYTYNNCYNLHTIEIVRSIETTIFTSTFFNCDSLMNVAFEGVIGRSISFSDSPLTVESMKNIITHLKNYAGTDSEKAYTLTLKSSCKTELETAGFTDEDKRLLAENGITYSDNLTWVDVIDDLKWNLVWAS